MSGLFDFLNFHNLPNLNTFADSAEAGLPPIQLPQPTWSQWLQASAPGRGLFGAMDFLHGTANSLEQSAGTLASGFGNYPNPVSDAINADAQRNAAAMDEREGSYQLARALSGQQSGMDLPRLLGIVLAGRGMGSAMDAPAYSSGFQLGQGLRGTGAQSVPLNLVVRLLASMQPNQGSAQQEPLKRSPYGTR